MKKVTLFISVFFLLYCSQLSSQWFEQSESLPVTSTYFCLDAIDANTAYAGTIYYIYKTTNGGTNWFANLVYANYVDDIYFINVNTGFHVARAYSGTTFNKTTNAGLNWVNVGYLPVLSTYSIVFLNENTGFASTLGAVYKTVDGGLNWVNTYTDFINVKKIFFTDINSGWGATDAGNLIRTTNGGASWDNLALSSGNALNNLFFINNNTGWVITADNTVYKSTSNGWTPFTPHSVNTPTCGLDAIYFANDMTGWVSDCHGSIYRSIDGGSAWTLQSSGAISRVTDIQFVNTMTGWAVGDGGVILKTTNGGENLTGINNGNNEIPDKFSLLQNYPNPFNPSTEIKYEIAKNSFVSLKVFDITGKEVMTLVNQSQNAGTYKVELNGYNLTSGIYFYRLNAGKDGDIYSETRKMMLIK